MTAPITKEEVLTWLEEVKDPEIPVLSLVDLGVITEIVFNGDALLIELTPTFTGCPALDIMKEEILAVVNKNGVKKATITVSYKEPWTSDKISAKGRVALKKFGLAPPTTQLVADLDILEHAQCPRCDGTHTELRNAFGPTLCRSIHYCLDCREAFEQFKPL
jgi:ring-1,2-phenylacetyl-CoA epoxidase subunit PaaD